MRQTPLRRCSDVVVGTLIRLNHRRCWKTYCLVPKRNWPILLTNLKVLEVAETSSRRLNWYVNKKYTDYLTNEIPDSFFLSPTNKEEIKFILSSLDISKSTGPYSIPKKVLNMLKNEISQQLADLFNLSFTTGTFPTLIKTIHKKDSKSNFTNYCQISLLSNLDKILEKLIHSRLSTFLNSKDIIYLLQFGFRKNYFTSYD